MFAEALGDVSTARLVYEAPGAGGVRIIPPDELPELRTALMSGSAALSIVVPDLTPATCPRGHPMAGD